MEGFIKTFSIEKQYGFICSPNVADIFFAGHHLDCEIEKDDTITNRRVRFEARNGPKGLVAIAIRPAN